ncbi:hypothetical protein M9435_004832 [Picochlorum sp. BPE23]|nr:hypothetical protein M9435_004832 [Picochlorum sp. BPE23]
MKLDRLENSDSSGSRPVAWTTLCSGVQIEVLSSIQFRTWSISTPVNSIRKFVILRYNMSLHSQFDS